MNELEQLPNALEIDLRYYIELLRQRWQFIVVWVVTITILTFFVSLSFTSIYRSQTTLFISSRGTSNQEDYATILANENLALTYTQMMMSRDVLVKVIEEMGLPFQPEELANFLTVTSVSGTQLVRISAENSNPALAAAIANTLATTFIEENRNMQMSGYTESQMNLQSQRTYLEDAIVETEAALEAMSLADTEERRRIKEQLDQYNRDLTLLLQSLEEVRLQAFEAIPNISQIETAVPPADPIRPNVPLNTLVAAFFSLVIAIIYIFGRDLLDDSVRDPDQLTKKLNVPVLGHITSFDAENNRLITLNEPRSPAAESFRKLRLNLQFSSIDKPVRSLLITSPAPSEGKSTTAINLGIALAQAEQDVLLIDGDLRRPRLHHALDLENGYGLSSIFLQSLSQAAEHPHTTAVEGLSVITSGPIPPNPSELFSTSKASEIIEWAKQQSDFVVFDAPPLLNLSDALAIAQHVDGVLLVARYGETKIRLLEQAVRQLRQIDARILGIVLTGVDAKRGSYYYYNYRSYQNYYENSEENEMQEQGFLEGLRRRVFSG